MKMNKAIGVAVVVAAAIAIFLFLKSGSSDEASGPSNSEASPQDQADRRSDTQGGARSPNHAPPRPLRMTAEQTEESTTPPTRNYIRDDGTAVRDHRSEAVSENYERRVTMPVGISPVQPQTLAAVRSALRPAMSQCIATHAADAPEGSKAQAVLTVSIQDENLQVDKLQLSTEGLAEDEELKGCIEGAILGHQQVVSGASDVAAHTMTFPYDL